MPDVESLESKGRFHSWWSIKKAEHRRTDAFEVCWRRLLRVPWTARRSNQSILKEISPEYSLEGLMLKLKLQYFGHLMWRTVSFEKSLMLGKIEGRRRRGWQRWDGWMASPTQWTWVWVNSRNWWWKRGLPCCSPWGSQRVGHDWVTELTELKLLQSCLTLCYPMDCSLPVSSIHGILQARILEWVAISSSWGSSQPSGWTPVFYVSYIASGWFYHYCHLGRPLNLLVSCLFKRKLS